MGAQAILARDIFASSTVTSFFFAHLASRAMLGYQMYSRYVMLVSLASIFRVYAGDLQASPEKTVQYDEARLKSVDAALQQEKKNHQYDEARLKSVDAALQQEKNNQNIIDAEWYHALEDTRQQLRKTKNEYDNYYFYSMLLLLSAAVLIFYLLKSQSKIGVAPSDGMDYPPLLHLIDAQNQSLGKTQHVQRGLAENNKETVYDEIQKKWDAKVLGTQGYIKTKKYDEIQKRWDKKVLGVAPSDGMDYQPLLLSI